MKEEANEEATEMKERERAAEPGSHRAVAKTWFLEKESK